MKLKSSRLFLLAPIGLMAVALGRHRDEADEPPLPSPPAALGEGWPDSAALRLLAKAQIAREVVAGRRPLLEAAALFGELNRLPPRTPVPSPWYQHVPAQPVPTHSPEEQLCWQVIAYVAATPTDFPRARDAVAARLDAEVRGLLRDRGTIRLPEARSLASAEQLLAQARATMTESQWNAYRGRRTNGRGP
jgi:hypothetical protein